ncbi:hypothetical protein L345_13511, partial [Ophiophagus hannah]
MQHYLACCAHYCKQVKGKILAKRINVHTNILSILGAETSLHDCPSQQVTLNSDAGQFTDSSKICVPVRGKKENETLPHLEFSPGVSNDADPKCERRYYKYQIRNE